MEIFTKKSILLGILCIFIFYTIFIWYTGFDKIVGIFDSLNWFSLIPIFSILSITVFLRSLVQKVLLNKIGIKRSVKENFFVYLAGLSMIITPGGTGVIIKSYFLKNKFNHEISQTLPITFIERFFDLIAIIILLLVTLSLTFSFNPFVITLILGFFTSIVFIILKKYQKIIFKISVKLKILKKFTESPEFEKSLNQLIDKKTISFMIPSILGIVFLESLMFYIGFNAFNHNFSYVDSIQVFYSSILVGSLALIPGGIGITEGFFISLLLEKGIAFELSSAIIIFLRFSTLWVISCVGFFVAYQKFLK